MVFFGKQNAKCHIKEEENLLSTSVWHPALFFSLRMGGFESKLPVSKDDGQGEAFSEDS